MAGSKRYYAPEMIFEPQYDFKADVWTCGVLLWELLTQKTFHLLQHVSITKLDKEGSLLKIVEPIESPFFKDLLSKIFVFDPEKRLSM